MTGSQLLIATSNIGKLVELRQMLSDSTIELKSLADFGSIIEVDETGATFQENARLKASGYALQTRLPTLADDSGLEVESLNGRPGILSARYGGDVSFGEKMSLLLAEIDATGDVERRARFVCSIAIADGEGNIVSSTEGICSGRIASKPTGSGGFGYDPIFVPDGYNDTFGELSETIKRQIGHRGRAFSKIMPYLRDFMTD